MATQLSILTLSAQGREDLQYIDSRLRQSVWQLFKDGILKQEYPSDDWQRQAVIQGLEFYTDPSTTYTDPETVSHIRKSRTDARSQVTAINAVNFLLNGSWEDGPHPGVERSATQEREALESYQRAMLSELQVRDGEGYASAMRKALTNGDISERSNSSGAIRTIASNTNTPAASIRALEILHRICRDYPRSGRDVAIVVKPLLGVPTEALITHLGHYAAPDNLSTLRRDLESESLLPVPAGVVETASEFMRSLLPSTRPFQ